MGWWTEAGNVVAPKPLVDLLTEAGSCLRDEIIGELEYDDPELQPMTDAPVFDRLDAKTRIFAIAHVLRHISTKRSRSPELYAWTESTLWALFNRIKLHVEMEVDHEKSSETEDQRYHTRRLVLASLEAHGTSVKRYSQRSRNLRLWADHLELIYVNYFWDMDHLDEWKFADMHPVLSASLKEEMGILPEYFWEPPPLVREHDFKAADRYIRRVGRYGKR